MINAICTTDVYIETCVYTGDFFYVALFLGLAFLFLLVVHFFMKFTKSLF